MSILRSSIIRLAASLPKGDETRRKLLRAVDFYAVRKTVLDLMTTILSREIQKAHIDFRLYRRYVDGAIELNLDAITVEPEGERFKVVVTPSVIRHGRPEVLTRGTDPRKLAVTAAKTYIKKYLAPDIEKVIERKEQKAREEAARREEERAREEARRLKEQQEAQETGTWSVARTGYDVGGDEEEEFQGYVAEVETFTSKEKAIAYAKSVGGGAVLKGTQMWNEPLGQIEESSRDVPYRYYR